MSKLKNKQTNKKSQYLDPIEHHLFVCVRTMELHDDR